MSIHNREILENNTLISLLKEIMKKPIILLVFTFYDNEDVRYQLKKQFKYVLGVRIVSNHLNCYNDFRMLSLFHRIKQLYSCKYVYIKGATIPQIKYHTGSRRDIRKYAFQSVTEKTESIVKTVALLPTTNFFKGIVSTIRYPKNTEELTLVYPRVWGRIQGSVEYKIPLIICKTVRCLTKLKKLKAIAGSQNSALLQSYQIKAGYYLFKFCRKLNTFYITASSLGIAANFLGFKQIMPKLTCFGLQLTLKLDLGRELRLLKGLLMNWKQISQLHLVIQGNTYDINYQFPLILELFEGSHLSKLNFSLILEDLSQNNTALEKKVLKQNTELFNKRLERMTSLEDLSLTYLFSPKDHSSQDSILSYLAFSNLKDLRKLNLAYKSMKDNRLDAQLFSALILEISKLIHLESLKLHTDIPLSDQVVLFSLWHFQKQKRLEYLKIASTQNSNISILQNDQIFSVVNNEILFESLKILSLEFIMTTQSAKEIIDVISGHRNLENIILILDAGKDPQNQVNINISGLRGLNSLKQFALNVNNCPDQMEGNWLCLNSLLLHSNKIEVFQFSLLAQKDSSEKYGSCNFASIAPLWTGLSSCTLIREIVLQFNILINSEDQIDQIIEALKQSKRLRKLEIYLNVCLSSKENQEDIEAITRKFFKRLLELRIIELSLGTNLEIFSKMSPFKSIIVGFLKNSTSIKLVRILDLKNRDGEFVPKNFLVNKLSKSE
mgnify:CR=1 FL=1